MLHRCVILRNYDFNKIDWLRINSSIVCLVKQDTTQERIYTNGWRVKLWLRICMKDIVVESRKFFVYDYLGTSICVKLLL